METCHSRGTKYKYKPEYEKRDLPDHLAQKHDCTTGTQGCTN